MKCDQCEKIPVCEIKSPEEYMLCVSCLARELLAGHVEMVYQTCPLDRIMNEDNKFFAEKIFHQFRCTKCGTIYGMLVNTRKGGQIKINDKVFNPDEYSGKEVKE